MTRTRSRIGASLVAGVGLALCALALLWPEVEEQRPFVLAVGVWPGMETLTLARERGVLSEVEVNFVEMSWTSATMMAFENRVVDGAIVTLDEMLHLKAGGHAIKAILVMGASRGGDAILARPEIASLRGLQGKRVGVELRASGEFLLSRALSSVEMKLSDVVTVPLNLAESENAYEQHELDALVTVDPGRMRLIEKGARVLFDSDTTQNPVYRVLVVREDLLKDRETVLRRLVKAHFQALPIVRSWADSEPGMAAILRRERLSGRQFAEALRHIADYSVEANVELLSSGPRGLEPILKDTAAKMKEQGLLPNADIWEGLLDARLVKGEQ